MRSEDNRSPGPGRIFAARKPLILASGSPRRRRFFQDLGVAFSVRTTDTDETLLPGEQPEAFVLRMAREKAGAVMALAPESWVVAADTVICIDGVILGKPKDEADAVGMLMRLSGRGHDVLTGFCIGCRRENILFAEAETTHVTFMDFSMEVARSYAATGEPLDKAGGYGIQGRGAFLVAAVSGSYSNVVGLPLHRVVAALCRYGVIEAAPLGHEAF